VKWGDLQPSQMARVVALYNDGEKTEIAKQALSLNLSPEVLERYCRYFNQYEKVINSLDLMPGEPYFDQSSKTVLRLPSQVSIPRLTDLEVIDQDTDQLEWVSWLATRASDWDEMTVMHACDVHEPFPDPQAVEMFMQTVKRVQPDLVVVGSDFGDFYLTTSFDTDPDLMTAYDDEIELYIDRFQKFVKRILDMSPDSKLVFIWGNHERRLLRKLMSDAAQFRRTIMKSFIKGIQFNGKVWYIGEVDHVRLGPLQVEHGNRHNEHVAKSRLIDEGGQVSLMFGHVHKQNFFELRGADYAVRAISTGCLCHPHPHYAHKGTSSRSGRKWTQGTGVASFSLKGRLVQFENIAFERVGTRMISYLRGEKLVVDKDNKAVGLKTQVA
jgi:hypothetical protein